MSGSRSVLIDDGKITPAGLGRADALRAAEASLTAGADVPTTFDTTEADTADASGVATVADNAATTDTKDADEDDEGDDDTFPWSYVVKLRSENARCRERARTADHYAKRLHTELVRATSKLADPTDLEFNDKTPQRTRRLGRRPRRSPGPQAPPCQQATHRRHRPRRGAQYRHSRFGQHCYGKERDNAVTTYSCCVNTN